EVIVASPARAAAGAARKSSKASRSVLTAGPSASVPTRKSERTPVDRILTAVRPAFLRARGFQNALLASGVVATAVLFFVGGAAAGSTAPRVLVAQFDNDINPVTASYLTGEI